MGRTRLGALGVLAAILLGSACIYDADQRCGPGERASDGYCSCKPGHVPETRDIFVAGTPAGTLGRVGCVACAEGEIAENEQCVCDAGRGRDGAGACVPCAAGQEVVDEMCACPAGSVASADGSCIADTDPVSFGADCTGEGDCMGSNAVCVTDDAVGMQPRAPYCTRQGCETSAQCPSSDGYYCASDGSARFCRPAASGEGDPCDMAAGLQDNPACTQEAGVCAFGTCHSPDQCATADDCSPGRECCNLSVITAMEGLTLCTLPGTCPL